MSAAERDALLFFLNRVRDSVVRTSEGLTDDVGQGLKPGLARSDHVVLGRILGTAPTSGFDLAEVVEGERLALTGRHRFARYRLVFELDAEPT